MQNFRNLEVWKRSMQLTKAVYVLTAQLPAEEKFGLVSQMRRAAVSIPSNIAEGSARSGYNDLKRFLEIALGSAFELETQLLITEMLEMLSSEGIADSLDELGQLERMINALITKVKTNN